MNLPKLILALFLGVPGLLIGHVLSCLAGSLIGWNATGITGSLENLWLYNVFFIGLPFLIIVGIPSCIAIFGILLINEGVKPHKLIITMYSILLIIVMISGMVGFSHGNPFLVGIMDSLPIMVFFSCVIEAGRLCVMMTHPAA